MAKAKKFKIASIALVSLFSLFLFVFGLILVIYKYDIYTTTFGLSAGRKPIKDNM